MCVDGDITAVGHRIEDVVVEAPHLVTIAQVAGDVFTAAIFDHADGFSQVTETVHPDAAETAIFCADIVLNNAFWRDHTVFCTFWIVHLVPEADKDSRLDGIEVRQPLTTH